MLSLPKLLHVPGVLDILKAQIFYKIIFNFNKCAHLESLLNSIVHKFRNYTIYQYCNTLNNILNRYNSIAMKYLFIVSFGSKKIFY